MRFASSARPTLTPLGHRLLQMSEYKLARLEPDVGGRDTGSALRKAVTVREAVKAAWRSVDEGLKGDLTDWSSHKAMGLDVIGEDEEEEEGDEVVVEQREERWFEDLMGEFGDEEVYAECEHVHEWTESNVQSAFDEFDYEDGGMEAYTISATGYTSDEVDEVDAVDATIEVDTSDTEWSDDEMSDLFQSLLLTPPAAPTLTCVDDAVEMDDDLDETAWRLPGPLHIYTAEYFMPASHPVSAVIEDDDDDDDDDHCHDTPPLVRSLSSSSCSSCDDDMCVTPPRLSSQELEAQDQAPDILSFFVSNRGIHPESDAPKNVEKGYETYRRSRGVLWLDLES